MSVIPRPSMRKWSVRMRWRTSFFVSDRNAAPISFSRPANCSASRSSTSTLISSVRSLRSCLAGDGQRLGQLVGGHRGHRVVDVVAVVGEDGVLAGRLGGAVGQLLLRRAQRLDERLGGLEAFGDNGFRRRLRAAGNELDDVLGGLGLDHHDGHVIVYRARGRRRPCRTRRARAARRSGMRPRCRRSARRAPRRWVRRTEGPRAGWTSTRR